MPGGVDPVHDDEQPDEKENRDPIDLAEGLGDPDRLLLLFPVMLDIVAAAAKPRRRTALSCRAEVQRPGEDEGRNDGAEDNQRDCASAAGR